LVVCDDLDLPLGALRIRRGGRSGGHHGLDSIIEKVGAKFCRLRLGIGRPQPPWPSEAYVLQRFPLEETPAALDMVNRAAEAAVCWATEGIEAAMNRFNGTAPEGAT
jgi:PTH1 family peptidyl-tRNA hydrolase